MAEKNGGDAAGPRVKELRSSMIYREQAVIPLPGLSLNSNCGPNAACKALPQLRYACAVTCREVRVTHPQQRFGHSAGFRRDNAYLSVAAVGAI